MTTPPTATRRFDLRRVYTALALVPAVYVIIRYLPPWTLTALLMVGGALALIELYRICLRSPQNYLLIAVGMMVSAFVLARHQLPLTLLDLWTIATLALPVSMLIGNGSFEHRLKDTGTIAFGVLYIGFTLSTVASTRLLSGGERLILFLALVTWAGDTGAYYAGTLWGKHLLAPSISPKKTIEGVAGGAGLALGTAVAAQASFVPELVLQDAVILGLLLTAAGLLGDLWESAIKRRAGVKDSGSILPGHGGMLDRLDSLLFTAPAFYYYMMYIRSISPTP
ncbi:MAG: phosphatidate cytidylyltransferase [Nitrospira sp.]|nr:phosphatidate cytidylyltransferase [Nitrospira sp.]